MLILHLSDTHSKHQELRNLPPAVRADGGGILTITVFFSKVLNKNYRYEQ